MPKQKDENKIKEIHRAARKLVTKSGFTSLKMADVAREAGIATGTLYVYYKGKEELINAMFLETKKEISFVLLSGRNSSSTFYNTIKNMWTGYFTFCLENPEKMLFVEEFFYSGNLHEHVIQKGEEYMRPFDDFLSNSRKEGLLKDIDIEIIKAHLNGSIAEIVKMLLKHKRKISQPEIEQCFEMAWNSIRK